MTHKSPDRAGRVLPRARPADSFTGGKGFPFAAFLSVVALFAACASNGGSAVPVETENEWEHTGPRQLQYRNSDPAREYQWPKYSLGEIKPGTNVFQMKVKKWSGFSGAGFGMLFCYDEASDSYYQLSITLEQRYVIEKRENRKRHDALTRSGGGDWQKSSAITPRYNAENTLKVVREITEGTDTAVFSVYINDTLVNTLTDTSPMVHYNGIAAGLMVRGLLGEKSPLPPVTVIFRY
jgi:hypothetical protein